MGAGANAGAGVIGGMTAGWIGGEAAEYYSERKMDDEESQAEGEDGEQTGRGLYDEYREAGDEGERESNSSADEDQGEGDEEEDEGDADEDDSRRGVRSGAMSPPSTRSDLGLEEVIGGMGVGAETMGEVWARREDEGESDGSSRSPRSSGSSRSSSRSRHSGVEEEGEWEAGDEGEEEDHGSAPVTEEYYE
jgi:hypothetical protein